MNSKNVKDKSTPTLASGQKHFRVFVGGAGMGPFGTGSGYAWFNESSGTQLVKHVDGLTNNVAEYRAFLSAVKHLPEATSAEILSDSQLMCCQFEGTYKIHKPELQQLLDRVKDVIRERRLRVSVSWVPRSQNPAGRLL